MSMSDPIADLLTRIRNALSAGHERVDVPTSHLKEEVCAVLRREGYITGYELVDDGRHGLLRVTLKYVPTGGPVIQEIRRISKQSLRVYAKSKEIKAVRGGLGVSIVSTSRGVMTGKQARKANIGGEVLCEVW